MVQFVDVGVVSTLEVNHKQVDIARKGEEVCIKIESTGGDAPKLYGRHFDLTDLLVSKVWSLAVNLVSLLSLSTPTLLPSSLPPPPPSPLPSGK